MNFRKIVKSLIPKNIFKNVEPYGHLVEAIFFNFMNGFPGRKLKVIGVTGTNGKTSTCFMIHSMLQEAGYKTGLMTTVAWGVGEDIKPQIHHWTNVPVSELMDRLKYMKKAQIDWLVLEATSQGLAQNRIWGVKFSVAAMTNITHEHLDYHGTFERYLEAKRKLFKLTNKNKRGIQTGVINAEDPNAEQFARTIKKTILYGISEGDLRASNIQMTPSGSNFTVSIDSQNYQINCHLPGSFNIYNTLAAIGVARAVGLSQEQIERGIDKLQDVEGRMTKVDEGQAFDVIVDYAHTPDSFEKLFKDLKPIVKGKLIVMFGSAGRRDEAKRPVQGELAGKYADEIILTEEDDRDIDGHQILEEIAEGVKRAGKTENQDLFLVHDRAEAIKFTLDRANKDDTVLLLGKGHEKTIEGPAGERPWDEIKMASEALKDLSKI